MITLTDKGLFCEAGGFHIDPSRRVAKALITHAHSDHARRGSEQYFCARSGAGLLRHRLGPGAKITPVDYRKPLSFGDVTVSFHPAGHILGSAQLRIEHEGKVWVVSGDYKREPDPTCEPFEVVPCDVFVTEATFGEPRYVWSTPAAETSRAIFSWWEENRAAGRNSVLFAYALGKTQRVLAELAAHTDREVLVFGEAIALTNAYRDEGVRMVPTRPLEGAEMARSLKGELVVAPHALAGTRWMTKLGRPATAFASGWMQTGAYGMRARYDRGFVLSDHADWPALTRTIQETGARRVIVMHGEAGPLARHLRPLGIRATTFADPASTVQGELFSDKDLFEGALT